ncbi:hypothetical protein KR222_000892 [Zaprionus bogoriensis]|nr:hypothetical protein KR222_000892 [Zaprionus bogoriensis]
MSNTSIRPIPTLKGMFNAPKPTQGRDFLKENKKSLRSLEKATTEKLAAKEPVRPKWMPPLRRTPSEVHAEHCLSSRQQSNDSETSLTRSHSNAQSQHQLQATRSEEGSERRVPSEKQMQLQPKRCQSCGTVRSSTNIGIQTEDIMDTLYLTNALKKCNVDTKSTRDFDGGDYDDNYRGYGQYEEEDQALSPRSNQGLIDIDDNEIMPLPDDNAAAADDDEDEEAPLSARSRATIASTASNATTKSKRREHKLGSRDDLRLPRYLEKEKRDKAEAKERIEARDPDCPRGHVLLSEKERLEGLASAKKRFEMLINELNHMPMTAQTLRVRARKAEIDKELTVVEDDIRIYSKAKVYVKAPKSRNL